MNYQIPTSSLLALHDAWLAEMQKEPSYHFVKPARIRARRRLSCRVGKWLVSAGLRLQARYWSEVPPVQERFTSPAASS
jgi:hypothetical protein